MNYLPYLESYQDESRKAEVAAWIGTTLKAFFEKGNHLEQGEVEHMLDFLGSNRAPRKLRRMSVTQAMEGAEKWSKSLQKKGNNIEETHSDIEVVRTWATGMRLVKLVGKRAFQREGSLMRHCVASYYGKNTCEIYSLRDAQNNPHATFEVRGQIEQIKGKGNGCIHPNYIQYVIESLEHFGMEVRESELKYLGYHAPSESLKKILRCFDNIPYAKIGGKAYVYSPLLNNARRAA